MNRLETVKRSGTEPGTPVNVRESVACGDGTIVSRTIFKSPAASIMAFAFGAGQDLSTHTAPFDAILEVVEGRARVTVGGRAAELVTGDLVVLPAGVPHAVEALERMKMLLTILRGSAAAGTHET